MSLKTVNFFDLQHVEFKDLFEKDIVYEILENIKAFVIKNLPKQTKKERKKIATIEDGAFIADDVFIAKGTIVEAGAYIKGPTIIGENCEIRQGAYIRGGVITGNNCVIGHTTEIKNSIMLNGAKAGHFAYIGDSILGNNVNLGAGTKLANLKLFNNEVILKINNKIYKTKLRKFGAILGDDVELGCNCVTAPGTIIGKNTKVYSNVSTFGYIEENKIVKNKAKIEIVDIK